METQIHLIETLDQAYELKDKLYSADYAALDTETNALPWYHNDYKLLCVAIALEANEAYVIPVGHAEAKVGGYGFLEVILSGYQPSWVMQNGSFDRAALQADGYFLNGLWDDTLAMQYLLNINLSKGLEDLAKRWLNLDGWKDIDYKHPEEEDLMTLCTLCGRDADVTLQVFHAMRNSLVSDTKLNNLYEELMRPAMYALSNMEIQGIPIDRDRLGDLTVEVEERLETLLEDIKDMAGDPKFNPNSFKQMQKLLFDKLGLPVLVFTDSGAPSTNSEALRKIAHLHPIVPLIQQFRHDRKLLTASLLPWAEHVDHRGYMHPRYKPAHARTGRLSSEMPNIQQVPRDSSVRRLFGGVNGYEVVEFDYSQLELRIVAYLSQEENMLKAFREGVDLHQRTADVLGVDRQTGKTANFGLLYGAGYRKLKWIAEETYGVSMSESEAMRIREAWYEAYPGIAEYHDKCFKEATETGEITTLTGRRRQLPDIYSNDYAKAGGAARQAMNTPVQGLASDITLLMVTELYTAYQTGQISSRPIATVHDSILFLVPQECYTRDVTYIKNRMQNPLLFLKFGIDLTVPLEVDVKSGHYWGEETP
jgi:DNA polymerase I